MKLLLVGLLSVFFIIAAAGVDAQTVYTTKTGKKYHVSTCHYLKYSKIEKSLEKAVEDGYTACSRCKDDLAKLKKDSTAGQKAVVEPNTPPPLQKRAIAVQCSARTQAGARCKRTTKNGSGRCWQHDKLNYIQ